MNTRLERLQARLSDTQAVLIKAPYHLGYLTGFPSEDSFLLVTRDAGYFLTDFRYIELAQQRVHGVKCVMLKRLTETLTELAPQHGIDTLYVETGRCTVRFCEQLRKGLPMLTVADTDEADRWLSDMRMVKEAGEIAKIEQAQAIAEEALAHVLPMIRPGVSERDIALELEFYMRKHGAQRAAFDCIVVSGANSSLPHGIPTDKPIERGDFVTMDFGAVVDGYLSDMTRTVAVGEVSDDQRLVYETVLRAQQAALSVLKEGLPCKDGDAAARRVIEQAGFHECFGHATGHGVGVQIHEEPRLSGGSDQVLQCGNVVTVEPGIYLQGRFGVRIEDMVVITEDGCRNLTHAPKDLLIV